MQRHTAKKSTTVDLMARLASAVDEARARQVVLGPDAAADRLVRHISKQAAQSDLEDLVAFFSSGLGSASEALHDARAARDRKLHGPGGDELPLKRDSSYWLG